MSSQSTLEKSVYIKTYGCQMNVYDTERMSEALERSGYISVEQAEGSDMVILNTCHIREKAAEKVYSELGRLRKIKNKNKDMIIGVVGCVAQAEGKEIIKRAPVVDFVFGPQEIQNIPSMLEELSEKRLKSNKAHIVRTDFSVDDKFSKLHMNKRRPVMKAPAAFVTVQEGCDKFCTFCVVPYTRGAEVSRNSIEIIDEVKSLIDTGVKEVTLLGQNVNAWSDKKNTLGFSDLLYKLSQVSGLERLRYTTSHPCDMNDELIDLHGSLPQLMPSLHLPVQVGSDKVLKLMNRKHTVQDYIDIMQRIRQKRPDIAFSSDFIVGFPGESDVDFEDTLSLVKEIKYAQSYSFKYSPRIGTPAALEVQIDEECKSERLQILQRLLKQQQKEFNQAQYGKTMSVLFEKVGKEEGQIVGRSPYLQIVRIDAGEDNIGEILPVKIEAVHENHLLASAVD